MKIGKFRKTETGYVGRIVTLQLQSDRVSLVKRSKEEIYDILIAEVIVGTAAAYKGKLTLELDDPSFDAPIRGQLAADGTESYTLISR